MLIYLFCIFFQKVTFPKNLNIVVFFFKMASSQHVSSGEGNDPLEPHKQSYLHLSANPIRFEPISRITTVFFDGTTKEVI